MPKKQSVPPTTPAHPAVPLFFSGFPAPSGEEPGAGLQNHPFAPSLLFPSFLPPLPTSRLGMPRGMLRPIAPRPLSLDESMTAPLTREEFLRDFERQRADKRYWERIAAETRAWSSEEQERPCVISLAFVVLSPTICCPSGTFLDCDVTRTRGSPMTMSLTRYSTSSRPPHNRTSRSSAPRHPRHCTLATAHLRMPLVAHRRTS
jgi:hypothetical protein